MNTPAVANAGFRRALNFFSALAALGLSVFLIGALLELPDEPLGLTAITKAAMPQSGVEHPVTAVLLNFRAYDTWLEVGVLLMAVMGLLLFQRRSDLCDIKPMPSAEPVLEWLIKLLFPMMVVVSGYLLWMGKFSSGGAFQAGVVLGAGGVLLWLAGHRSVTALRGPWFRLLLIAGFIGFAVVALINVVLGQAMLDYPLAQSGTIILLLEAAATISIAVTVSALIIGLQPVRPKS
jgi:multisubunit Na+/H+ antiporter MnhB subunit